MVSIQHHLSVILPLGQEFQRSARFTNEFQKALFSIVEFKNILNYIYNSLFKAFFWPIFLSYSLIFHCLVLISLSFLLDAVLLLSILCLLCVSGFSSCSWVLDRWGGRSCPAICYSFLIWFPWGKTLFWKYYSTMKCFYPLQIPCLKVCQ